MNKLVLITGAARGIGAACARKFAKNGNRVILHCNHSVDEAKQLAKELEGYGSQPYIIQADLTDEAMVKRFCKEILTNCGTPDIIVNNAGIAQYIQVQDISGIDWDYMMNANVKGQFLVIRELTPAMIEKQKGSIVNMSSIWGLVGGSCESHYSASKGAVIAFTKALAKELGPSGIRVNCVAPGCVRTAMTECLSEETLKEIAEETPLGRIGTPEDIANAVYFLAEDDAAYITGQVLSVNGGSVIV